MKPKPKMLEDLFGKEFMVVLGSFVVEILIPLYSKNKKIYIVNIWYIYYKNLIYIY